VSKKFPLHPRNPQRICWGCDKYCAADDMACGNGSSRTQHPVELFGDDWNGFEDEAGPAAAAAIPAQAEPSPASK
jgi:hypothetical protein